MVSRSKKYLSVSAVVFTFITACGKPSEIMGGEFSSLQQCLSSIESSTGLTPTPVIDNAEQVSGYLADTKRDFACSRKSTGTQGVFWDGWYEVE